MVGRVASSGQRPSFKPFRLFDEKRAALPFSFPFSFPLSLIRRVATSPGGAP
ncbi:hypothetical protein FHS28_000433 [Roseateles terrae]|uniref:PilS cassette n=1 Tax=Roseateles terrae TaxID=431060 RepID=A0ABR6GLS5_9BURK|nr:hypothetical protein [Roseateles terrae]